MITNSGIDSFMTLPILKRAASSSAVMYSASCGNGLQTLSHGVTALSSLLSSVNVPSDGSDSTSDVIAGNLGNNYKIKVDIPGLPAGQTVREIGLNDSSGALVAISNLETPVRIEAGDVLTVVWSIDIICSNSTSTSLISFNSADYYFDAVKKVPNAEFSHNLSEFYCEGGAAFAAAYVAGSGIRKIGVRIPYTASYTADGVKLIRVSSGAVGQNTYQSSLRFADIAIRLLSDETKGLIKDSWEGLHIIDLIEFSIVRL